MPHALLIKFPGTNCDAETARALEAAGFTATVLPAALLEPTSLEGAHLVVFSGGFSYGDYVMSGRIAQLITKQKLGERLKKFVADGGYVLGICNGFQILTQLDLLPRGSLIHNTSGRFHLPLGTAEKERQHQSLPQGAPRVFRASRRPCRRSICR
jgi:phosphoribosylformylglycinamidine (FGAM) synthase-like amidotransferase family enzyme